MTRLFKRIGFFFGAILLIIYINFWLKQEQFEALEGLRRMERVHASLFVASIDLFCSEHHKLPTSSLELEQSMIKLSPKYYNNGYYDLKGIINRDHSFFNRSFGKYFGWDHRVTGYGKSYDDFDKYANKIQIGEAINPEYMSSGFNVYIPGCQGKLLYRYDKEQKNTLLLTCHGDQLLNGGFVVKNQRKKNIYKYSEKELYVYSDKMEINSSSSIMFIHKHSKRIESMQFVQSEFKTGRISKTERDNWLEIGYKDLNGNKPKSKWFF